MPIDAAAKDVNSTLPVLIDALENVQDEIAAKCRVLPGPFIQQLKSLFDNFEPTFSLAPFIQKLSMARVRACCAGAKTMGPDAARSAQRGATKHRSTESAWRQSRRDHNAAAAAAAAAAAEEVLSLDAVVIRRHRVSLCVP